MALVASALVRLPILIPTRSGFLHQKRFTKWSRIDSSGSHKSVSATWIAERIYDSYYRILYLFYQ